MTSAQELMIKGKTENQIEVVRNGWSRGYTAKQLSELTGVPIDKIKELFAKFALEAKVQ